MIPIWALSAATVGLTILSIELGFRLGRRYKTALDAAQETHVNLMVQATLGLLAFMIGFTFGLAGERYNDRTLLVVDDANAIRTAYSRAAFLPDAERDEVRTILREYLSFRTRRPASMAEIEHGLKECDRLQDELNALAVKTGKADMNSDVGAMFIESVNELVETHFKRVALGLQTRVPEPIWAALYFLAALTMGAVGYHSGIVGPRKFASGIVLIAAFSLTIMVIADLDRPQDGFLRTSLQPLIDLQAKIGKTAS